MKVLKNALAAEAPARTPSGEFTVLPDPIAGLGKPISNGQKGTSLDIAPLTILDSGALQPRSGS